MESYEFVIPGRPVSLRTNDRAAHRRWVERVKVEALHHSPVIPPFWDPNVRLTIVFLCRDRYLIDIDNIIKPIQDALTMVFYADDRVVSDVEAHRRSWSDDVHPELLPALLGMMWEKRHECVYVRVQETRNLEELL